VILGDPATREALVIDPGDEPERILEVLRRHDLTARQILHTHAHIDHVGATARVHEALQAAVALHPHDRFLYDKLDEQAEFIGTFPPAVTEITTDLTDGQGIRWGSHEGEILHTPGHSPGSICLHVPETRILAQHAPDAPPAAPDRGGADGDGAIEHPLLVSGDTLFWGSIGRTDLWGGSYDEIMKSIRERLLVLPDHTLVIPGHGPATILQQERIRNPFLQSLT
jgi:glyoxylase-like metal-dependent hydrolase (beta-lactamase superfamily II)